MFCGIAPGLLDMMSHVRHDMWYISHIIYVYADTCVDVEGAIAPFRMKISKSAKSKQNSKNENDPKKIGRTRPHNCAGGLYQNFRRLVSSLDFGRFSSIWGDLKHRDVALPWSSEHKQIVLGKLSLRTLPSQNSQGSLHWRMHEKSEKIADITTPPMADFFSMFKKKSNTIDLLTSENWEGRPFSKAGNRTALFDIGISAQYRYIHTYDVIWYDMCSHIISDMWCHI